MFSEARKLAQVEIGNMLRGIDPVIEKRKSRTSSFTLGAAMDYYLEKNRELREKTKKDFRSTIEKNLSSWIDKPLREIDRDMVEKRHNDIQQEVAARGRSTGREGITGERTANMTMKYVRTLWYFSSEKVADLPDCPVRRLTNTKAWFEEGAREDRLSDEQLPRFYEAALALPNEIQRDYLLFILFTGMRRREAGALDWKEVDLKNQVLRLPKERTKQKRKLELPLSEFVCEILTRRKELRDGSYVFPASSRSKHIEDGGRHGLSEIRKKTDIHVTIHGLRRTFITIAEAADISYLTLKCLAGHSIGGDVTASHYAQPSVERLREPLERVTATLLLKINK